MPRRGGGRTPFGHLAPTCPSGRGQWQRTLFDAGWLLPGNPPEYGGRNATLPQQLAHLEELAERGIYHSFNPQGLGIIAASILTFGTEEQKQRWAVPILRAEITASLGMSEPGAGLRPGRAAHPGGPATGTTFVVNGQKVWTSGAHDADVLLTFVRTDPDAPKHKGISVLLIPTDVGGRGAAAVRVHLPARTTSTSTRCSSPTCGCRGRTWSAS